MVAKQSCLPVTMAAEFLNIVVMQQQKKYQAPTFTLAEVNQKSPFLSFSEYGGRGGGGTDRQTDTHLH